MYLLDLLSFEGESVKCREIIEIYRKRFFAKYFRPKNFVTFCNSRHHAPST